MLRYSLLSRVAFILGSAGDFCGNTQWKQVLWNQELKSEVRACTCLDSCCSTQLSCVEHHAECPCWDGCWLSTRRSRIYCTAPSERWRFLCFGTFQFKCRLGAVQFFVYFCRLKQKNVICPVPKNIRKQSQNENAWQHCTKLSEMTKMFFVRERGYSRQADEHCRVCKINLFNDKNIWKKQQQMVQPKRFAVRPLQSEKAGLRLVWWLAASCMALECGFSMSGKHWILCQ